MIVLYTSWKEMEEEEIIEILKKRGRKTKNLKGIAKETKIKKI